MEVAPVILGVPLLLATFRRFRLTPLLYRLIFLHALILIVGGHYTYAKVPVGFWVQELFELSRNHYDRLGHLAQGFVPAILSREILVRTSALRPGGRESEPVLAWGCGDTGAVPGPVELPMPPAAAQPDNVPDCQFSQR